MDQRRARAAAASEASEASEGDDGGGGAGAASSAAPDQSPRSATVSSAGVPDAGAKSSE